MTGGNTPLLTMRQITKRYGAVAALNAVNFDIRAGEIHALLGENGAGKSTLMHILAGLTRPDSGEIQLNGTAVRLDSPRVSRAHGIAAVHQHFTLVPAFTVAENLALDTPFRRSLFPRNYAPIQEAKTALERGRALGWNLDGAACVADLSVGTQQRVEIIKALAKDARLLIFDEPTAVLAGDEVEELFHVLRQLRDEGRAVVLIAHKLAEILAVADRVTVLRRGQNVASALVSETNAVQLATWMIDVSTSPPQKNFPLQNEKRQQDDAPYCVVSNLNVTGDRSEQVLRDCSLTAFRGEILGIGGVDGNGQTELAEALVGLRTPTSGSLTWNGQTALPRTGYIPQDRRRAGLAVTMSVGENLLFEAVGERAFRVGPFLKRKALRQLTLDMIRDFDIRTSGPDQPASALSGGNQQKIVAARALRSHPDWIVAMNPTRGLDIGATRFVHEQLRQARQRGASIVVISTDWDELAALSDRTAILANGKLTEYTGGQGDVTELGLLLGGVGSARQEAGS